MHRMIRSSLLAGVVLSSLVALAGDSARAGEDCGVHTPRLLSFGGPVVASPRFVPVTFAGDALAPSFADFVAKVAPSRYLSSAVAEYGVGSATAAPPVAIADAAPAQITNLQIESWIASSIASGALPAPASGDVYVLAYPETTEVDFDFGFGFVYPACFSGMNGFHGVASAPSGALVPFVVSLRCGPFLGLGGIDAVTTSASAEMIGAVTDPHAAFEPAWGGMDFRGSPLHFQLTTFGPTVEAGELCELQPAGGGAARPADVGYSVARVWSNRAAAFGHDPCVPSPTRAYFGAAPLVDGTEPYPYNFTQGVTVLPGTQVTIPVRLFGHPSSGDTWTLSTTTSFGPAGSTDPSGVLSFSWDDTQGGDGDVRMLTITRAPTPPGAFPYSLGFAIVSTRGSESHAWVLNVGQ